MYLAPPSGFLDWSSAQWSEYLNRDPVPDSVRLGRAWYVGSVIEAVFRNLENDEIGSRFPIFMKMETSDPRGWYADEVGQLLSELDRIKAGLAALPISRATLGCDSEDDVKQRIADFKKTWPQRPVSNLYDLHFYFFEEFEKLAKKAQETGHGLFVVF